MALIRHILVPTDFSDTSGDATEMAIALAEKLGARITFLHSTWMPPSYYSAYAEGLAWPIEEMDTAAARELERLLAKVRKRIPDAEGHVVPGEPWERIIEAIDTYKPDLVVLGTHGRRGLSRAFMGSVAERVVRLASVPVLTVRPSAAVEGGKS